MYRSINSDPGLNVYAVYYDSSNDLANGTGFETYSAAHWTSLYAMASTEQGSSGHYSNSDPAYLTAGGSYTIAFFERLGASAAVGDRFIGAHNFTVESSDSITVPTALITKLRILANDTATSNFISAETPVGTINSSNTHFRTQYQNLVSGSVYLSNATVFRSQAGFTVDATNGLLTFSPAPSDTTSVVDYNFQWFTDTDYSEFLSDAALLLGSDNDPATVVDGLIMALLQYGLFYFYMRRATQYANKYASTGGQASQSVESVTGNFRKLAELSMDKGDQFRTDYYEKQGQQKNPAAAIVAIQFDPMTPRR